MWLRMRDLQNAATSTMGRTSSRTSLPMLSERREAREGNDERFDAAGGWEKATGETEAAKGNCLAKSQRSPTLQEGA